MSESSPRIAALEAQLAEAQERLAMAVDVNSRLREAIMRSWDTSSIQDAHEALRPIIVDESCDRNHIPTAASVAQHTAEVERRGAAKELRRLAGQVGHQFVGTRRYNTADLLARAAELEGA